MLLKEYKYYLFDLDRTLWDFDLNAKNAIFKLLSKYNLCTRLGIIEENRNHSAKDKFFERYEIINHDLWDLYETGKIPKDELRINRFADTFRFFIEENKGTADNLFVKLAGSEDEFKNFCSDFSDEYLENMVIEKKLIPGAKKVLKEIKARGGYVAILSNGFKEVQYRKIKRPGLMPYIDAIVISEEVGVHKPSPLIYRKAIEKLLCVERNTTIKAADIKKAKNETLMIGDDFPKDIEGAQIYGIDQFYFNPHCKPCYGAPTYESNDLKEIMV